MDWLKLKAFSPSNRVATAALMHRGQWQLAIKSASSPYKESTSSYYFYSILARSRCHLALGDNPQALHWAQQALQPRPATEPAQAATPAQWLYAHLLAARARLAQGATDMAIALLTAAYKRNPTNPRINHQLALCLIDRYGDWSAARQILGAAPITTNEATTAPVPRAQAWFGIQSQIYNGASQPQAITQAIAHYSQNHLSALTAQPQPPTTGTWINGSSTPAAHYPARRRVGLASPMLCASPVYFLCIGALRHLAQDFDLVFFYTGKVQDWATEEFRLLSTDWHHTPDLSASALTHLMRACQLHVLVDMAGWLDQTLLHAAAQRPAPRQYKWVGGQSATTGLYAFDGFITDCHQSPPDTAALYTEPLALMPSGYVTYTPPHYMPPVRAAASGTPHTLAAGIVAHPKKLSAPFMRYLRGQIQAYGQLNAQPINLCFVGWRYDDPLLQRRIYQALGLDTPAQHGPVTVQYLAGKGHAQQLQLVAALDWVVDTFPYTSGVTALEALALGVPLRTHVGPHFSQRHGYSHARFSGMAHQDILLAHLGALGSSTHRHRGHTLLSPHCARLNHVALAHSLAQLFAGHPPPGAPA